MTCSTLQAASHFTAGAVVAILGVIAALAFAYVWLVKGKPW